MVQWAEEHPVEVAKIVQEARKFAELHLSELGQTCYMARLLQGYSALVKYDAKHIDDLGLLPASSTSTILRANDERAKLLLRQHTTPP